MKKFLHKFILFSIPVLLVWLCLEIFYRYTPNNYSVKNQSLKTKSAEIETLLFGDSHCLYGLNPQYFSSKTFNLGNVSQTIYFDKLLFEKYIDQLPKLKQVVFCIEYTNLSQKDNTGEDDWRKFHYQRYMHLQVPSIAPYDLRQYSVSFTQNLSKTRDLLKRYFKTGTITDCDGNGWGTNYKKEDRIPPASIAERRAKMQEDGSMDFRLNTQRLQEIINKCKAKNIQVLIVSMPQTAVYEHYLNQKKLNAIIKTCTLLRDNNPENVKYLNLFHDKRFSDEDFFDADHLNDAGAGKASKIVNEYLSTISTRKF